MLLTRVRGTEAVWNELCLEGPRDMSSEARLDAAEARLLSIPVIHRMKEDDEKR